MSQINIEFADRYSKISEALEEVGLGDLEKKLIRGSLISGLVQMGLYKDGQKVGEILYDREPPIVTLSDKAYDSYSQNLIDYFRIHGDDDPLPRS
ncbi:MAG: hypothetical protein Q8R53_05545 [Nanoarchaeota archaeon]|nr:hypothetical protein [Nanoarchaeota archaeon]